MPRILMKQSTTRLPLMYAYIVIIVCRSLWEATNNTVGFNHMVASGPDAAEYNPINHSTVALAMETMYGYTAYFPDNDPRLPAHLCVHVCVCCIIALSALIMHSDKMKLIYASTCVLRLQRSHKSCCDSLVSLTFV